MVARFVRRSAFATRPVSVQTVNAGRAVSRKLHHDGLPDRLRRARHHADEAVLPSHPRQSEKGNPLRRGKDRWTLPACRPNDTAKMETSRPYLRTFGEDLSSKNVSKMKSREGIESLESE